MSPKSGRTGPFFRPLALLLALLALLARSAALIYSLPQLRTSKAALRKPLNRARVPMTIHNSVSLAFELMVLVPLRICNHNVIILSLTSFLLSICSSSS